jgi:hypothetical protein
VFEGDVKVGFKSSAVQIVNGAGSVRYMCGGAVLLNASADIVRAGPAALTNVRILLTFGTAQAGSAGGAPLMKSFYGSIVGTIDFSTLSSKELPAEALSSGSGGSGSKTAAVGATPESVIDFKSDLATDFRLKVVKLTVNIGFGYATDEGEFTVKGLMAFTYPCLVGDTASAVATLDANMPGKLVVKAFDIGVVYVCGVLAADRPRWTITGETTAGVEVAGATVGRCRSKVSKPVLKAPMMVSALETRIS